MNDLKTDIAANWKLTEQEVSNFLSAFDLITLQKGEAFSLPGVVCNQIGLIQSGLMKCVLVENEKEFIFEFPYENSFIALLDSRIFINPVLSGSIIVLLGL